MEKRKMTKREQDVYSYILEYRKEKRFSPSMRDIAAGVGLHSVSTIHVHVHNLMDKGWLQPVERMNRTIIPMESLFPSHRRKKKQKRNALTTTLISMNRTSIP